MEQNIIQFPNSPGRQTHDRFLGRIQGIVQSRYGTTVSHIQHYHLNDGVKDQLEQMSTVYKDGQLFMPVHFSGKLKSVLVVHQASNLHIELRTQLIDLLRATAIPYFEHIHRSEHVATQECYHQDSPEDIISLKGKTENEYDKQWDWTADTIETRPVPILILGDKIEDLKKAAFELHHVSPRLVFLSFTDIDVEHRQSPARIAELSESTIFIPELEKISKTERNALFEYLQVHPDFEDGPAIYFGTTLDHEELLKSLDLNATDRRLLPRFHLNLKGVKPGPELNGSIRTFIRYSTMNLYV